MKLSKSPIPYPRGVRWGAKQRLRSVFPSSKFYKSRISRSASSYRPSFLHSLSYPPKLDIHNIPQHTQHTRNVKDTFANSHRLPRPHAGRPFGPPGRWKSCSTRRPCSDTTISAQHRTSRLAVRSRHRRGADRFASDGALAALWAERTPRWRGSQLGASAGVTNRSASSPRFRGSTPTDAYIQ